MNYQNWKIKNPTKSINEYYIAFSEKKSQVFTVVPNTITINNPPKATKEETDYLLIFASILIIVAFFLPWVNIKILGLNLVNSSGADIPKVLKHIYKDAPQIERFVKAVYLIPFGAFLVLLGVTNKER